MSIWTVFTPLEWVIRGEMARPWLSVSLPFNTAPATTTVHAGAPVFHGLANSLWRSLWLELFQQV